MGDDFDIPPNTKELENALNKIHSDLIKPKKDESKDNKEYLTKVLDCMVSAMEEDEVFKAVYRQLYFQGSSYEKLRVGSPDEFDINLELRLPVDYAELKIETLETIPGFARIKLGTVTGKKGEQVQKTAEGWIDVNRYLLREKILSWLQSLVDKVLPRIKLEFLQEIKPAQNGPAVTLTVRVTGDRVLHVDLVPCLVFDGENLPAHIRKRLDGLPSAIAGSLKWSLVPKGPREFAACKQYVDDESGSGKREWRMSFYEYEKSLMNGLDGMKPTIKLLKLIRDRWEHTSVSSYYIKTMFLWEICKTSNEFWQEKDRSYLFIYMLRMFEKRMLSMCIPFFWDEGHNLVSHLCCAYKRDLGNFLKHKRTDLENALRTHQCDPVEVLYKMFKYEKPCMESCIQGNVCDVRYVVDNEKDEETRPLLWEENEGSFFSLKNLLLLGVGAVTVIGAVAAAVAEAVAAGETRGERGEDNERRRGGEEEHEEEE